MHRNKGWHLNSLPSGHCSISHLGAGPAVLAPCIIPVPPHSLGTLVAAAWQDRAHLQPCLPRKKWGMLLFVTAVWGL